MQALDKQSMQLVDLLQREYGPALGQDPELPVLLQAVKEAYFDVPRQGMGGMLGSIFQQMLGPGEGVS